MQNRKVNNQQHWDHIFANTEKEKLGWHEESVEQTLKLLKLAQLPDKTRAFVAGAGVSKLIPILMEQGLELEVNDISLEALNKLKAMVTGHNIHFLHRDLSLSFEEYRPAELWIDRAVLHFLLDEVEIKQYFHNLKQTLKPHGYALFAEFSTTGATQCAGLPIRQYSVARLEAELGAGFRLIHAEDFVFINPFGQEKPYIYCLFQRT